MKRLDLSRHTPPGANYQPMLAVLLALASLSLLFSVFSFSYDLNIGLGDLYIGNPPVLKGGDMRDFHEVLGNALIPFPVSALCMLAFIAYFYAYYHTGSKSIYLMRRLPRRMELHRRCLTLPAACALLCLIIGFALLLCFYAAYMISVPDECRTPDQWQKLWRSIL